MKTSAHKDAAHAATTTIATSIPHSQVSVGPAVEQALADTDKPSAKESLAQTHLPTPNLGADIPGVIDGKGADAKDGASASVLQSIETARAGMLDAWQSMLAKDPSGDPTSHAGKDQSAGLGHGNLLNDWLAQSQAEMHDGAGLPGSHSEADLLAKAGANPAVSQHQKAQEHVEGMLGAGKSDGTDGHARDYTDDKGHQHTWMTLTGKEGDVYYDKDKSTGVEVLVQQNPDGTATVTKSDGNRTTVDHIDAAGNQHIISYDDKGNVVTGDAPANTQGSSSGGDASPPSGDTVPLEPLHPEGEKKSQGKDGHTTPDADHRNDLPPGFDDVLADTLKQTPKPSHSGDDINVAGSDNPGNVSVSGAGGPIVESKVNDSPVDPMGPAAGIDADGAPPSGSPPTPSSGMDPNLTNTLDATSSGTGPEEPDHHHEIEHDPPGSANADGAGSDPASHGSDHPTIVPLAPPIGSVAETPAEKAGHQIQDTLVQHDGPGEPLVGPSHAVEKSELGPGGHLDAGNGFSELIKAAQDPVQSGLAIHPVVPEIPQHLAIGADIASHGFGPHDGDDASALHAAPMAALHDAQIDHHVEQHAAPVLDHIVAHH